MKQVKNVASDNPGCVSTTMTELGILQTLKENRDNEFTDDKSSFRIVGGSPQYYGRGVSSLPNLKRPITDIIINLFQRQQMWI